MMDVLVGYPENYKHRAKVIELCGLTLVVGRLF